MTKVNIKQYFKEDKYFIFILNHYCASNLKKGRGKILLFHQNLKKKIHF